MLESLQNGWSTPERLSMLEIGTVRQRNHYFILILDSIRAGQVVSMLRSRGHITNHSVLGLRRQNGQIQGLGTSNTGCVDMYRVLDTN